MEPPPTHLSDPIAVVYVFAGILTSLLLPVAVRTLKKYSKLEDNASRPRFTERLRNAWRQYGGNTYLGLLLAASLVAGVVVFFLGMKFYTPRDAALAGFAWESLVNKLLAQPAPAPEPNNHA